MELLGSLISPIFGLVDDVWQTNGEKALNNLTAAQIHAQQTQADAALIAAQNSGKTPAWLFPVIGLVAVIFLLIVVIKWLKS